MDLQPKRQVNLIQSIAIIVGAVIGSGVFLNIPIVANVTQNSTIAYLVWLIGGIFWIPQILVLAEMGTAYPNQGGPYVFLYKAGSPLMAFLYTWTAFITSDTPTITIIGLMAISSLKIFFPFLSDPVLSKIFAGILIINIGLLQRRSIKTGSNIQIILTSLKILPLIGVIIFGIIYFNPENILSINLNSVSSNNKSIVNILISGVSATVWAYAGFINILYISGELKNPGLTLPKSLFFSLTFVIFMYLLINIATYSIVGLDEILKIKSNDFINPFLFINLFENIAGKIFSLIFFISMLGVLNSALLTQPRLEYATAKDGLFFRKFGELHPKYLTPSYSILFQTSLAVLLFTLGDLENIMGYFTLSYVIQNSFVYLSIFFLRKKSDYLPSFRLKRWKIIAIIAFISQVFLIYGTAITFPFSGIAISFLIILSGIPVYLFFKNSKGIKYE